MSLKLISKINARTRITVFRLGGLFAVALLLLSVTSSFYESGNRKIVLTPVSQLSGEQLQKKPNIIVVLSEAFWDPTVMENVKFSRDPIPFFHALAGQYSSGWLFSPQFGGVTANVEFEVLTGNSVRFLSTDTVAYEQHVKTNIDSLASILSGQGYTAKAISPFHNWFANSRETYQRFGFSRFISMEFFNPNEYEGPYLADRAVAKRIIEETQKTDGPDFIYANTMENHYHFWPGKFKHNTIDVKGDLPRVDAGLLETYAQGISDADRMLEQLVSHYSQSGEPTVIVFFGDHLPFLEDDYMVYVDAKYISGESDPDFLTKIHRTPVIVWNNFAGKPRDDLNISPSFLSPYVLHLAGLQGTDYTNYLYDLSRKIPVIPPKEYYEKFHIQEADLQEYEQRQQAMLAGELTDQSPRSIAMGYGDPALNDYEPKEITAGDSFRTDAGRSTLIVRGGPFGLGSTVLIDGKPQPTTWQSESALTVVLPKETYASPGSLDVQVKVIDEKETVLAESKPVRIKVLSKP
ncbi:LTA synthase family protein [Paenibacillus thalictri]|uniref:LTA synthase family protein n=2 Tax=Paenibacillus thalictri TaxID=2527873 RepID=A0A4Q9DT02_9BACL|nr:LTA synthase family protein [Paenibacillus thalictri]